MAKKTTATTKRGGGTKKKASASSRKPIRAVSTTRARRSSGAGDDGVGEAFVKLLQSPLAADLLAVAATAALAALAEHGFSSRGAGSGGSKAGRAVKEAGKAVAAAIGRRLGTEIDEIRKASKATAVPPNSPPRSSPAIHVSAM